MRPDELDHRRRERLDALGRPGSPRRACSMFLMRPDLERVEPIGEFWSFIGVEPLLTDGTINECCPG